jgi:Mce-associated membrane protein
MPDRSRNRPRIAGQRRTSGTTLDELTTNDIETPAAAPETRSPAEETSTNGVTPATSTPPEAHADEVSEAPAVTDGDTKRGLGRMLTVALGVAVVLVLTVAVVLGIKAWQGRQAEDARDQAAAAGRKAAETALSYDYRDLDKSFAEARATMTPEFAGKFDETAKVAGELATKTKATVKADVREVGVRDGDTDRVTLIIFVNQTTTSTITQGKPRVDLNRTRFTMVRKGDQWLVQEIAGL